MGIIDGEKFFPMNGYDQVVVCLEDLQQMQSRLSAYKKLLKDCKDWIDFIDEDDIVKEEDRNELLDFRSNPIWEEIED